MKKLFYTIDFERDSTGESLNGNKTITVYEMENNQPKKFCDIETINEAKSQEEIQGYLDDNGFGDETFELIQL